MATDLFSRLLRAPVPQLITNWGEGGFDYVSTCEITRADEDELLKIVDSWAYVHPELDHLVRQAKPTDDNLDQREYHLPVTACRALAQLGSARLVSNFMEQLEISGSGEISDFVCLDVHEVLGRGGADRLDHILSLLTDPETDLSTRQVLVNTLEVLAQHHEEHRERATAAIEEYRRQLARENEFNDGPTASRGDGIAAQIVEMAIAMGFDPTNPEDMAEFIAVYNQRIQNQRRNFPEPLSDTGGVYTRVDKPHRPKPPSSISPSLSHEDRQKFNRNRKKELERRKRK